MPIEILMPALSPTMEEGTLSAWHVKEGDTVRSGDVIAEIETDKATMEVEAVDEGVIGKIMVEAGREGVKVNAVIALLLEEGEDADALTAAPGAVGAASAAGDAQSATRPTPTSPASGSSAPGQASAANGASRGAETPAAGANASGDRIKASPLARRLAALDGIDLAALTGSGPGGRIIKKDIEAARASGYAVQADAASQASPSAPSAAARSHAAGAGAGQALSVPGAAHLPSLTDLHAMGVPEGSYDLVPLDGMRKTIARRMTDSFRDTPHFPLTIDVALDQLLAQRKRLNGRLADDGVKISVNDFLIRAAALALQKVPAANASYSTDGILYHHSSDIAVAVAIEGGLITPIIRRAEAKGMSQISQEMKDLAQRARDRKLMPEEYSGGTFSISNLGMFGIKSFASILNAPQGMIMSVGAGDQRPIVKDGAVAIATLASITLTCDHRVVDGAIGAQFLQAFQRLVEDPETMLL